MKTKVLFAVLNWGLGHATRSQTIIEALAERGFDISIASSGLALDYLKIKFPSFDFLILPDREVNYSRGGATIGLFKRAIIQQSLNEKQQKWTSDLLNVREFDLIISDNVYGVYKTKVPSVLISHQLKPLSPVLPKAVADRMAKWINRFEEVWIPDFERNSIAGEMVENSRVTIPKRYLGNISRFKNGSLTREIDNLAIISGPEPQAGIFHDLVLQKLKSKPSRNIIACKRERPEKIGSVEYRVLNEKQDLNKLILKSKQIICRSGFTSLLDILKLQAHALVVPTPGQPEQEYLANRMKKLGLMHAMSQKEFTKRELEMRTVINIDAQWTYSYLEQELDRFINSKMPSGG